MDFAKAIEQEKERITSAIADLNTNKLRARKKVDSVDGKWQLKS